MRQNSVVAPDLTPVEDDRMDAIKAELLEIKEPQKLYVVIHPEIWVWLEGLPEAKDVKRTILGEEENDA